MLYGGDDKQWSISVGNPSCRERHRGGGYSSSLGIKASFSIRLKTY